MVPGSGWPHRNQQRAGPGPAKDAWPNQVRTKLFGTRGLRHRLLFGVIPLRVGVQWRRYAMASRASTMKRPWAIVTWVLAGITLLVLAFSAPASLRQAFERG